MINTQSGFNIACTPPFLHKSRVRMYFLSDSVDFTDDSAVVANGELLVKTAGETDSNRRISEEGITLTRYFNKDTDFKIGDTVSNVLSVTFVNDDGALDNFDFTRRCKVYLDAYNSGTWYNCPIGVFRFERPVKQKVQYIAATAYDIMQEYDVIADSWWNALDFTNGLTLRDIASAINTNLGLPSPVYVGSRFANTSVTYTIRPFTATEMTYRDILAKLAEAMSATARINAYGQLEFKQFYTIGSGTYSLDCDSGNTFSGDIADYSVSRIDKLRVMAAESDYGAIVGTGTNGYEIVDNPFLYGATQQEVTDKATSILSHLSSLYNYWPISIRYVGNWAIEAGDIIRIRYNGKWCPFEPIFQQTISWRGKNVYIDLVCTGNPSRPIMSQENRSEYRGNKTVHEVVVNSDSLMSRINDFNGSGSTIEQTVSGISTEVSSKVGDDEIISKINQSAEQITIQANKINLEGTVTANNGFSIDQNGYMTANGATINGSIESVSNDPLSPISTVIRNGVIDVRDSDGNVVGELTSDMDDGFLAFAGPNGSHDYKSILDRFSLGFYDGNISSPRAIISGGDSGYLFQANDASGNQVFEVTNQNTYIDNRLSTTSGGNINVARGADFNGNISVSGALDATGDATIGGALGASGNASVGGDLTVTGDVTVNGVLDVERFRCSKTLSAAGWYRALTVTPLTIASGAIVKFKIIQYGNGSTNSTNHEVTLSFNKNGINFRDESSNGVQYVTKIRVNQLSSGYAVDIYYSDTTSRSIDVFFEPYIYAPYRKRFSANSLESVADSPTGETVKTVYDFHDSGAYFNDLSVGGVLDVTQRRCSASLSSAGWYRVLSYTATSATNVTGGVAFSVDFTLFEQSRECHKVTLNGILSSFGFGNEYSVSNVSFITKIRYTYDSNNVGYVDIYYDNSSSRSVTCFFDVHIRANSYHARFVAESLQSVAASPSGETILTEYSFAANTDIGKTEFTPTNATSYSTYGNCYYERQGRIVHVHIGVSGLTANAATIIASLPSAIIPSTKILACGMGGSFTLGAICRIEGNGSVQVCSEGTYALCDFVYMV